MIEFRDVRKTYRQGTRDVVALDGVRLALERGILTAITGPSGSGKSTLLHLAAGLDQPTSGDVLFEGRPLAAMSDRDRTLLRRRRLGFVFQFFHLVPSLSVFENAALPLLLDGRPAAEVRSRVEALLERTGLAGRASHRPEELSGGEMQRVAIARALAADPPILLADEPTGNLDSVTGSGILDLLRALPAEGRTVVLVTHDAGAAARADRVVRLRDGKVEA